MVEKQIIIEALETRIERCAAGTATTDEYILIGEINMWWRLVGKELRRKS